MLSALASKRARGVEEREIKRELYDQARAASTQFINLLSFLSHAWHYGRVLYDMQLKTNSFITGSESSVAIEP